jgi:hypothetical protein
MASPHGIKNPPVLIETLEAHNSTGKKTHSQILHFEKGEWNSKDALLPQGLAHTSKATNRCFSISLASLDRLILAPPSLSTSLSLSLSQKAQDSVSLPLSVRPFLSQKAQDFVPLSLFLSLTCAALSPSLRPTFSRTSAVTRQFCG